MTDQLFFKGVTRTGLGGYYGPSPSDHAGLAGTYTVVTSVMGRYKSLEQLGDDVFEV